MSFEAVRGALRAEEISLGGPLSFEDSKVCDEVQSEVRRSMGEIDKIFTFLSGMEGDGLSLLFMEIYGKIYKAALRYTKKCEPDFRLCEEDFELIWCEVKDLIAMFNANGVSLDNRVLLKTVVYQGSSYWREFFEGPEGKGYQDFPGVVRRAVVDHPRDPRKFLREVEKVVEEILGEDEFAGFKENSGVIRHVVASHPIDPRKFLREMERVVGEILGEDEFAIFKETPGIISRATVSHPSDPRGFLREVDKVVKEILRETEFAIFKDTPWIISRAAVGYPTDPRGFLREVDKVVKEILREPEFGIFKDTPGIIRQAAVCYPTDPRKFLRGL